ncbi:cobalt ECF transporter T component CbiQ [Paenibacillus donghaensis]|uniref:Cobalt ECF transporter T component CbiQ n=1 Tax=Paenibacillus donghaensis TaxID=414771 RepID=A0A2Z2K5W7_9BACL|nr:cobalt ECF transporter T component CbiQ [Paenibacillus donghaensis]ASA20037.1 cobalt ECF transporter T component CbiQ [Paenibacillus donghaensis]
MIRRIDAISYANGFRQLSPLWKSLFAAVMFILSYLLHPFLQLTICLWIAVWCLLYARIPVRAYVMLLGMALLFYVLSLPALLLEIGHPAAGQAWITFPLPLTSLTVYITAGGVLRGGLLLARLAACLSCLLFVIFTTPFTELLLVLRRLRVPQLVLELMLIMYRFLFLLSDSAHGMLLARRLRGGSRGFRATIREAGSMGGALLGQTMRRYRGLSQGLAARGFTGEIPLPPYSGGPVPLRYRVEGCSGIAVLLLAQLWMSW